jgi:branched-chain amino acid transport system substrate-binding protein
VLYNRGMLNAMLAVESVRAGQLKYGRVPLSGEQVRWGLEHLNLDTARIKALGMDGMLQPLKTSCLDHEGAHRYRLHTWDGARWAYSSDWYESDARLLRPMVDAAAKKYAGEKFLPARDCGGA